MAREIQVLAWCDACLAEDRRVPVAATHEVALDGKAWTLDLCEDHEVAAYKPFQGLAALGARPEAPGAPRAAQAPRRGTVTPRANLSDNNVRVCLLCDTSLANRNIHDRHLVQVHRLPKAMALYGDTCPFCAESFTTPQGLAIHGVNSHQHYDLSALFRAARDAGDPHGVVAASVARVLALGGSVAPMGEVVTREDQEAQRVADRQRAADAFRRLGLHKGQRGVAQAVADALGISHTQAEARLAEARRDGILADD